MFGLVLYEMLMGTKGLYPKIDSKEKIEVIKEDSGAAVVLFLFLIEK